MTKQKAFRDAVLTVVLAALLVACVLFYVVKPLSEYWIAIILITLVPALLMLPVIYRRYVKGPGPPLTRQQHLKQAVICGLAGCGGALLIFTEPQGGWNLLLKCCCVGIWLLAALNDLRLANKENQENPFPTH